MNNMGAVHDLALSNTPNATFNSLMVTTTAGSVVYVQRDGTEITLANVPVGEWIPTGEGTNVKTTSTAVGIMVV